MARKTHFRRLSICLALFAALGAATWAFSKDSPLTSLFQKGKTEFKLASYESSLATFDQLHAMSQQPGYERERAELVPVIAFYRGANLAALGETEAAKKEFEKYLASSPNVRLDPSVYPKPVIATFKKAREEVLRTSVGRKAASDINEIEVAYTQFRPPDENRSTAIDERWAAGPVRYLMAEEERAAWDRMSGPVERAAFVASFWEKRDPNPETPENEFWTEFEKRVLFADKHFQDGEKKGSETDRGLVFALLGPPTYIRYFSLSRQEDFSQASRMRPGLVTTIGGDGSRTTQRVGGGSLGGEPIEGTREVWYYKRDRLPSSLKFAEVGFEFITKRNLGTAVLQREPQVMRTLEQVVRAAISTPN